MINVTIHLLLALEQVEPSSVEQGDIQNLLILGAGIFALVLSLLSLYAWTRRRQPALLLVSVAFLVFFLKEVLQLLPQQTNVSNLILGLIDFVILAVFFAAVVIRPRKRGPSEAGAGQARSESPASTFRLAS